MKLDNKPLAKTAPDLYWASSVEVPLGSLPAQAGSCAMRLAVLALGLVTLFAAGTARAEDQAPARGIVLELEPFFFLGGYELLVGLQDRRNQFSASISQLDLLPFYNSQNDDFDVQLRHVELTYTRFFRHDMKGFHAGVAAAYLYDVNVERKDTKQAASSDFWRVAVRLGYYWYPFDKLGLFLHPCFTIGTALGSDDVAVGDLTFEKKLLQIQGPTVHIGWRLGVR